MLETVPRAETVKNLIRFLCEKVGIQPVGLELEEEKGSTQIVILRVTTADLDKLLVEDQKLLKAMQAILAASASAQKIRVNLEIEEAAAS